MNKYIKLDLLSAMYLFPSVLILTYTKLNFIAIMMKYSTACDCSKSQL